jgi:hypothetical protein
MGICDQGPIRKLFVQDEAVTSDDKPDAQNQRLLRLAKTPHGSRNNGNPKKDAPNRDGRRVTRPKRKWGRCDREK